jgi:hypothetical protein
MAICSRIDTVKLTDSNHDCGCLLLREGAAAVVALI